MMNVIQKLKEENILSAVGCRVNGGGCNRALITTSKGVYILGGGSLYVKEGSTTRTQWCEYEEVEETSIVPVFTEHVLKTISDLEWCTGLQKTGYEFYSSQNVTVHGLKMRQLDVELTPLVG
jgi:hypothetical protein